MGASISVLKLCKIQRLSAKDLLSHQLIIATHTFILVALQDTCQTLSATKVSTTPRRNGTDIALMT